MTTLSRSLILFNIELHPGVARSLLDFSVFPDEKELLLPPGTLLRVASVIKDTGDGLAIVQLKMIEPVNAILAMARP